MIDTTNPIIKHKAGLLNLAEELGKVSKAGNVMGVSRDTFYYRYQRNSGAIFGSESWYEGLGSIFSLQSR